MKKILGLDIGTTSIGWAIVEAMDEKKVNETTDRVTETSINNERISIHKDAVGVRIISQDTERFDKGLTLNDPKGSTLTPTATRRKYRNSRRMKNRYKLRRDKLLHVLNTIGIKPEGSFGLEIYGDNKKRWVNESQNSKYYSKEREFYINDNGQKQRKKRPEGDIGEQLYSLRNDAISKKIELQDLGRILLHLNQLRGYSSDRFAKDEKPKFDYYLVEVLEVDGANRIPITEENNKEEIKYYKVAVKLKFEEPYNIGDEENKRFITEINGFVFKKEIDFQLGDYVTIKKPELRQEKKGKSILLEYYKITLTTPDPTDWNYKYQTLQQSLIEWCETGGTVGSYFFRNFYESKNIPRIRNNVINREWFEQEFDKVWDVQFRYHKDFFGRLNLEEIVKAAFKDYEAILNEVKKKEGIKEQLKYLIKDKIIFYQRPWQQAKNKAQCPFEKVKIKKEITTRGSGKKEIVEEYVGRTVIPRSHPLFQEFKIWQQINNVRLFLNTSESKIDLFNDSEEFKKYTGRDILEIKQLLYDALQNSKTLSWRVFIKDTLNLKNVLDELEDSKRGIIKKGIDIETGEIKNSYFSVNFRKRKRDGTYEDIKLKGNSTKVEFQKVIGDNTSEWFTQKHSSKQMISNLQLLWEIIYDITNTEVKKVAEIIEKHFGFDQSICIQLASVKFDDAGMGNLSAKAIRQILPLMSSGENATDKAKKRIASLIELNANENVVDDRLESLKFFIPDKKTRIRLSKLNAEDSFVYLNYWEATAVVYGSHAAKNTRIQPEIKRVKSHSMNNPIVEKIVNETIGIVNEIYKTYGFDEVRIELSRELKASMDERQQMWEGMMTGEKKNAWAKQMLREAKQALLEDNRNIENLDTDTSNKSNIDKIKIIEDVVKYNKAEEYKSKSKEYKLNEPTGAEVRKYLLWLEQNFKCPYTNQPIPFTDVFAKGKIVQIEHIIPRERYYLNSYVNKVITWREVNQAKADYGNRTAYEFIVSKRKENTVKVSGKELELVPSAQWDRHVKSMFPKGGKQTNLLRKEIPEDPIERTLKETQYINKKLKEKLAELVGEQKVWITSGAITDILRDRWHLNYIMKELMRDRFENFEIPTGKRTFKLETLVKQEKMLYKITEVLNSNSAFKVFTIPTGKKIIEIKDRDELKKMSGELGAIIQENKRNGLGKKIKAYGYSTNEETSETKNLTHLAQQYNGRTEKWDDVEVFEGYSKRLDYRHHALDAIIIACTKQNHIQYINTLNAINTADQRNEKIKKAKYNFIKADVCKGNSSKQFKTPWDEHQFLPAVKKALDEVIISHKNTRLLISPSKHRMDNDISANKVASIRGELHKETNYSRKNYFERDQTDIGKLIPLIFKKRQNNQYQTMVHVKSFEEIIKETVLKEKYQNILIQIFERYGSLSLNDELTKELSKEVLKEIVLEKTLVDTKTGKPLKWLSTYSEKDKSSRPLGLSMNLNDMKEVNSIADPRIRRLAGYRLNFVNEQITAIDKLDIDKKEKDARKAKAKELKLYSNAIYEVRIELSENNFEWVELKNFSLDDFDKISYAKSATTTQIKAKLKEASLLELKQTYFEKPIFLSERSIEVKKVKQMAFNDDLYEITNGRYVFSRDVFMSYLFVQDGENQKDAKRSIEFLKFLDATRIIGLEKPAKIEYRNLKTKEGWKLLFTLAKNDLVYIPKQQMTHNAIEEINWSDKKDVLPYLYIVKDMNPSRNEVVFQQFCRADSIKISASDARSLFNNPELKEQTEKIKYGDTKIWQRCIKVFSDKLGRKIVPYWEFPNGCWTDESAKKVGLI